MLFIKIFQVSCCECEGKIFLKFTFVASNRCLQRFSAKYPNIASIEPKGDFFRETTSWFDCFLKQNNSNHSLPMMRAYINSFDTPSGKWKARPGRWIKEKN